jgi:outer membrane protein insertion porin family
MSSVVHGRIVFDNTDSREQPTRGYMARIFAEYGGGGLGGDDNFFRPVGELQGFHSLTNSGNHVFHWRGRMGGVFENSSKSVPIFDRFFIGGIDSIRGYSQRDLSPRDKATGDEIGADRIGFTNLEYIWTFYPDLGMAIVPFYDVGYAVDSKYNNMFEDLKQSVGLELRWRSPMGDLRFAYGYPLSDNVRGERRKAGRFEFSMGQFF